MFVLLLPLVLIEIFKSCTFLRVTNTNLEDSHIHLAAPPINEGCTL